MDFVAMLFEGGGAVASEVGYNAYELWPYWRHRTLLLGVTCFLMLIQFYGSAYLSFISKTQRGTHELVLLPMLNPKILLMLESNRHNSPIALPHVISNFCAFLNFTFFTWSLGLVRWDACLLKSLPTQILRQGNSHKVFLRPLKNSHLGIVFMLWT